MVPYPFMLVGTLFASLTRDKSIRRPKEMSMAEIFYTYYRKLKTGNDWLTICLREHFILPFIQDWIDDIYSKYRYFLEPLTILNLYLNVTAI